MARAAGLLFLCGATVGAISVLLPHSAGSDDAGLWSNIVLAYLGAAGLLIWGQRLPRWCFHVAIAVGTLVVSRAVYLSDDPGTYYAAWYVWVGLYTFFFFSRAQAAAHISLIALCYAAILLNHPGDSGTARWVTMVTTLLVAGAFISVLVRRVPRSGRGVGARRRQPGRHRAGGAPPLGRDRRRCDPARDLRGGALDR